jgi:hypothetical protein
LQTNKGGIERCRLFHFGRLNYVMMYTAGQSTWRSGNTESQ